VLFSPVAAEHVVGEHCAEGDLVKSIRLDLPDLSLVNSKVSCLKGGSSTELSGMIGKQFSA
jgi:hypothetical protein